MKPLKNQISRVLPANALRPTSEARLIGPPVYRPQQGNLKAQNPSVLLPSKATPLVAPGQRHVWQQPYQPNQQKLVQQKTAALPQVTTAAGTPGDQLHWPPVYRPTLFPQVQAKTHGQAQMKAQTVGPRQPNNSMPAASGNHNRIAGPVIQRVVMHLNRNTRRWFDLTFTNGRIDMDESEMSRMQNAEPHHYGYLIYNWAKDAKLGPELQIKTLVAEPEEGSGIGVFLMYAAVVLANSKGVKWVRTLTMARNKLTYYNKFGFDVAAQQEVLKKKFLSRGASLADLSPTIGDLQARGHATAQEWEQTLAVGEAVAPTATLLSTIHASVASRWKTIGTTVGTTLVEV